MKKTRDITRAIIDSTVDRGLKELDEDPRRSIRKLNDLGRQFSKGRFMQEIFAVIDELLKNEDSPYYLTIEHIFHYTSRKALKTLGVNIGYSSLTKGGKQIRELQEKEGCRIPWHIFVRMDPKVSTSLTPEELYTLVDKGTDIGIYTYTVRLSSNLEWLERLCNVFKNYPECAFIFCLPDEELSQEQASLLKSCPNAMSFMLSGGDCSDINALSLRRQKVWYGSYAYYSDSTCSTATGNSRMKQYLSNESSFCLLIADDNISESNARTTADAVKSARVSPIYPILLFDLYGDAINIGKLLSDTPCFFEIKEDRSIHTNTGIFPPEDTNDLISIFKKVF